MRLLFLSLCLAGALAAQVKLANPGFEDDATGSVPSGWFTPPAIAQAGYKAEIVDQGCRTGAKCAKMTGAPPSANAPFGNLIQSLPAEGYRQRRIVFRAAVRVEGPQTRAQMWLRLDGAANTMLFLDNMSARPITSSEWKTYEIVAGVPEETERIVAGVMQFGPGTAWVDDASLEITGEFKQEKPEPARPLTAQGLANLTAFARLYGYVRWFHPSPAAARADWEDVAIAGVRTVEPAANTAELIDRLRAVFGAIAPAVAIYPTGKPPAAAPAPDAKGSVRYVHHGVGLSANVQGPYRSLRVEATPPLPPPFETELVPGVSARVPLIAPEEGKSASPEERLAGRSGNDRATRLGDVIIAWNVMEHFYPYFDVVKTDWPAELPKAMRSAATDADARAFTATLQRLVAALHDGHGRVGGPGGPSFLVPPIAMDWVEGQFIVTQVPKGIEGVAPGDRIAKIDGRPLGELVSDARSRISAATEGWMRTRLRSDLSWCDAATRQIKLELEPYAGGAVKTVELPCAQPKNKTPDSYPEPRPAEMVAELEPGIFYVDLDRVGDKEWSAAVPRLEKAKGIVFDMRGYPSGPGIQALAHLTDNTIRSARWNVPNTQLPDHGKVEWEEGGWPVPPQKPYFTAKRAFITDGRAISYAETVMGIVEAFRLGEIVGEPTAGTNGNVNPFQLPGGYSISWTGMKVLKHDGSQHHGIGIRPTVPVSRTRMGVAEGKDELLLKAIEVVKR